MLTTVEIIKKYNLYTKKSFGQNFLTTPELLTKIVNCAGNVENENVLEIGTGPAGLTTAILKKQPKKLITVDMDERCVNIANTEIKPFFPNLEAIHGDALKINENELFNGEKYHIIANLPYNIGTVLLFKWLENKDVKNIKSMTLLLQKEVVERIVSQHDSTNYGRLSVMCQYICDVKKYFDIAPSAFTPPPKVVSSVVGLTVKQDVNLDIVVKLSKLCQVLFNQRRKTVLNNLKKICENAEEVLSECGINVGVRVEDLKVEDFVKLVEMINKLL